MLQCEKCGVSIRTNHECCPLCHGGLSKGTRDGEQIFPNIKQKRERKITFLSTVSFICVVSIVTAYIVKRLTATRGFWFWYMLVSVICVWVVIAWGKLKRRNLLKNAIWQTVIISAALLIWDGITGFNGWSIDYAIPILVLVTLAFNIVFIMAKRLPISEYMIYLLIHCMLGIIPLLLDAFHVLRVVAPSIICGGASIVILSAMLIFNWNQVIEELAKNFHV